MSEWISVKDRLPEGEEDVLVCLTSKELVVGAFVETPISDDRLWMLSHGEDFYAFSSCGVTHWMPLPEPPEEVQCSQ